ncbi:LuxR C-terminal-related transcriptional regulator [Ornithinimicrobium sp. Y1847]|uniref:LuxR C-terminal-related transcriptional regulator n=1 Tax=Ornithinimicrobium sp. Y1847 TaxID=3405419 RepID=UPI003B67AFD3
MTAQECRELLEVCRPSWRAGHGDEAWAALEKADTLAGEDPELRLATLATRAGLHLLAEQLDAAAQTAREAIAAGEDLAGETRLGGWALETLSDARVTLASLAADGPYAADGTSLADALRTLDGIARDPELAGRGVVSRAVNNALVMRLHTLGPTLRSTPSQVEAWVRVGEARALLRDHPDPVNVLRVAVDLGIDTGQWERAWSSAQEQFAGEDDRNEVIAVLAKAALLAWHRGLSGQARELGSRAWTLSVAVDHPWVRTYAYLGGVLAAAAGGGDLGRALRGYARCTSPDGHATRPHRAWLAAWVALESGRPVLAVEDFLTETLPGGLAGASDEASLILADVGGADVDPQVARRVLDRHPSAPTEARVHLALARTFRRQGRPTAASRELARARDLLRDWPGWLLGQVEQEAALVEQPVAATPAQTRVLDLLVEGLANEDIAAALDLSPRTVAVHVASLLRANGLPSRTALVAQHLRSQR